MKHCVLEGVAVPAVLASSFTDPSPSRRPFSYTKPLPPCTQAEAVARTRARAAAAATTTTAAVPRSQYTSRPSRNHILQEIMPSNIQYNTPMPIYSREAAEEQYKQQVGAGPDYALGARDRHFDPEKSETLKAIKAGETDDFGRHFNEQIAQAEAPHIPPPQEPYWAQTARSRSERARSATPSATYTTPNIHSQYVPHYSTLQHSKKKHGDQRSYSASKRGYEFGGLDYVDKSRIPHSSPYVYYGDTQKHREERRTTPGYEMGGTDFGKGTVVRSGGPYHGHGPEQPRLQSKFEQSSLKHDEMNIEIAPNVDRVSADILVGDTRSNQHIAKDEHPDHSFGTSFGPTAGFKRQHRTIHRQEETPKPTTFSLSAKKDTTHYRSSSSLGNVYRTVPSHTETVHSPPTTELAGYTSQAVTNYASHGSGTTRTGAISGTGKGTGIEATIAPNKKLDQTWIRSHSAAPVEKYEWANNENTEKEVTIETLLNGRALLAGKRSVTPEWHWRSLEKHDQWKNRSDPRLTRSQTFDHEPTWSRIVSNRRNAWEEKARNTDARVQMPPSSKIPPQQPPHWYNKANRTHTLWQSEADRQSRSGAAGYIDSTQTSYDYTEYGGAQHHRNENYSSPKKHDTESRQIGNYDSFITQTQYTTHGGIDAMQRNQSQYHTKYSDSQQQQQQEQHHYTSDSVAPAVTQNTYTNYAAVPVGPPHPVQSNITQQTSNWQSQSSSSRYERKMREHSMEHMVNEQPQPMGVISLPASEPSGAYGIEKTSYQRKTHHETTAPLTTASAISITQGSGDFNRRAEMAEILPRGTVANTEASTEGKYVDNEGRPVTYKRELVTSVNPNSESTLLKEEETRVVETPLEPGVISRHVTTKYYKKKTVTDTTTTTNTVQ